MRVAAAVLLSLVLPAVLLPSVRAAEIPARLAVDLAPVSLSWKADGRLLVSLSMPAEKLIIERGGIEVARLEQPNAQVEFRLPDSSSGQVIARLLDVSGAEMARSKPLAITLASVNNTTLKLNLAPNRVFGSKLTPVTVEAGPGTLSVLLDGKTVHTQEMTAAGTQVLPALPMPQGRHRLQIEHLSEGRTQTSPAVQIFSFGIEPPDHSYLLADKYSFSLYWIKEGVLHKIYPVATGRPSLPTQPGFWLIGAKDVMHPASDWGSYRLRIYRENQYTHHWSGYAVHGTNKPNSIGTEASHGCLRMFNKDITELYQGIAVGTPLVIEEHMKVYIEEIAAPKVAGQGL